MKTAFDKLISKFSIVRKASVNLKIVNKKFSNWNTKEKKVRLKKREQTIQELWNNSKESNISVRREKKNVKI